MIWRVRQKPVYFGKKNLLNNGIANYGKYEVELLILNFKSVKNLQLFLKCVIIMCFKIMGFLF